MVSRVLILGGYGQVDISGIQVIGWDPIAKAIRSWTFDSNGGFAEGKWEHRGDRWFISPAVEYLAQGVNIRPRSTTDRGVRAAAAGTTGRYLNGSPMPGPAIC